MIVRKFILLLSFLFTTFSVLGQGFTYSFTDPCTFKSKQITINNPNGNVALIYNTQVKSFTPQELINGSLEQWISEINSTNPSGPCSGIGLAENTNLNVIMTQNNIAVLTTVLSTLTELSTMNGFSNLDGIVGSNEKAQSKKQQKKKSDKDKNVEVSDKQLNTNNESNNNSTGTDENSTTNKNNGNTDGDKSKTSGNGNGDSQSGTKTTNGNSTTEDGKSKTEGTVDKKENTTNDNNKTKNENITTESTTTKNEDQNKSLSGILASIQTKEKLANVKKGSLMMNGDIVVIRSANKSDRDQFKINMSVIKSNTKNTFAKGALLNFTSSINNSCLTFFTAWRYKNLNSIIANSSMLNFQKDFFNTTSFMESYKIGKITTTIGANITTGNLGKSNFKSIASLGGILGSFNINQKIGITPMVVVVYSPYVYYYQGIWYKSGWLLVPFTAVDYRLTKKFKMNLSFSGVQQLNSSTINFQVLLGAKTLL